MYQLSRGYSRPHLGHPRAFRRMVFTDIPICGARLVDGCECACESAKCDCCSERCGWRRGRELQQRLCVLHVLAMHRCSPIGGGPRLVHRNGQPTLHDAQLNVVPWETSAVIWSWLEQACFPVDRMPTCHGDISIRPTLLPSSSAPALCTRCDDAKSSCLLGATLPLR
jgi:hypothetical protein